jgi:hypothetical protein
VNHTDHRNAQIKEEISMRQTGWLFAGMILVWTSLAQANGLEFITPPLWGRGFACLVTNASDEPVDVALEILDNRGQLIGGSGVSAFLPLWTTTLAVGHGFPPLPLGSRVCRVTSEEAKKGDLKVTFCVTDADDLSCKAAVTSE